VPAVATTPANRNGSKPLPDLLDKANLRRSSQAR